MKGTVEGVSNKFGPSFKIGDTWYNPDKKENPSFEGITKGTEVEWEGNGKWVKSIKILKQGQATPAKAPGVVSTGRVGHTPELQSEIRRMSITNAVLGSPSIAEMLKGRDVAEVVSELKSLVAEFELYAATGSFEKANNG